MTTSLINYGDKALTVSVKNEKFGMTGTRLMTGKEFSLANNVKGAESKRRYNAYLKENGQANMGALASEMTTGKLIVVGFKNYDKSGKLNVAFQRVDKIKDPVAKTAPAAPVDVATLVASMDAEARNLVIAQYLTAKTA